jgi:hypothetical protein
MPIVGQIRNSAGIRLFTTISDANANTNFVALLPPSVAPTGAVNFRYPNALPGTTQALTVDSSGNMGYTALGGGGSVTSVALALPNIFSVSGSPITVSGTLNATLVSQNANLIFAAPNGSAGTPTFRSLVSADIPQTLTSAWITDFDTQVRTSRLDQMAAPTAAVSFNSQRITNLATPTNDQDAVTKAYADALISTGNNKGTVRVATTAALSLTSANATSITQSGGLPSTLDGVTLSAGNLILVKDQVGAGATGAAANGLYVYAVGTTWTRATNSDTTAEVNAGLFVFVSEGTVNADNGYTLTTNDPITLGTTQLTFTQTSGAGQITAGAGLTKTGNQLDVGGTANRITVNADTVDIAATYAGQTSITTLGTIGTGTWQGTAIAVANGGTGATTAANARTNLGAAAVFRTSFTSANVSGGLVTINHNLGIQYGILRIYDNNNRMVIPDEITMSGTNSCTADLTSWGTISGTWNAVYTA